MATNSGCVNVKDYGAIGDCRQRYGHVLGSDHCWGRKSGLLSQRHL
jgi:hypothetical protein